MRRLAKTKQLRAEAESTMRFHHYLETMGEDSITVAFDHNSILDRLAEPYQTNLHPKVQALIETCRTDVLAQYYRAIKEGQLAYRRLDPVEELRLYPLHFAPVARRLPAPVKGKVSVPSIIAVGFAWYQPKRRTHM